MIYTYVATALIAAALAATGAWKFQEGRYAKKEVERIAAQQVADDAARAKAASAATAFEGDRIKTRTKFVTITETVDHVIAQIEYRDRPCLDDAGLRILNTAISATDPAGEPSKPLPAASATR